MTSDRLCRWCDTPLAPREGRGRRPAYCDGQCRRAAEFEIRRLRCRIAADEMTVRVFGNARDGAEARDRLIAMEYQVERLGGQPRPPYYSTTVSDYSTGGTLLLR